MRGVKLKESISLFGLRGGFNFWFGWSFRDSIQMLYWKIINKPYCLNCGYYCKEGCNAKKLYTRKEIKEQLNKKICSSILNFEDGSFCMCELDESHNENHKGLFYEWEGMKCFADNSYKYRAENILKIKLKDSLEEALKSEKLEP